MSSRPAIICFDDYRAYLAAVLEHRIAKNPRYSLRAFARSIVLSPSRLSEVINNQQKLSLASANTMLKPLELDHHDADHFRDLIRLDRVKGTERAAILRGIGLRRDAAKARILQADQFEMISDACHLIIVELLKVHAGQLTADEIATRLNIERKRTEDALQRLASIGYLASENDYFRVLTPRSRTSEDIPSAAIRQHHAQMLDKAKASLASQPVEAREVSNTILAIDRRRLPEIKTYLRKFREQFVHEFRDAAPDDAEVYGFGFALFSLESPNNTKAPQ